ncbi:serine hydrolase domain-containing protein [Vibrio sp. LaRot3]|uniref:serine hydrolase domain-containing protein n=1 Tax=Vibrio sp. LaRot3 TaxID=2998829 RepID=UPI0022CE0985|nr:serine hydrolase domain-containing protein [Vibrio sp. LaRot3]MDA0148054.1 serine hydrolase [Vibrio sp. LaRot3]
MSLVGFAFLSLTSFGVSSHSFEREKLDTFLNALAEENVLWVSVDIRDNANSVYSHQTGFSKIEYGWFGKVERLPIQKNSRYKIASISKTFTAVLVFQLIEQGKLSLDTPLSTFYPSIPNAESITIGQMLMHWSGIFNYTSVEKELLIEQCKGVYDQDKMVDLIASYQPTLPPATYKSYSNSNYVLLSGIVEQVAQRGFGELLNEKIISKLGLENTFLCATNECEGYIDSFYFYEGKWYEDMDCSGSYVRGSGSMVSTAEDLTRFSYALFNGELISPDSLTLMKGMTNQHGMGLEKIPYYYRTMHGHTGSLDSFLSVYGYFEDDGTSIAMIANTYSDGKFFDVFNAILDIYHGKSVDLEDVVQK